MAIVSVRNSSIQESQVRVKTGLIWLLNNGTVTAESNKLVSQSANATLGRTLDAAGSRVAQRELTMAINTRFEPAP